MANKTKKNNIFNFCSCTFPTFTFLSQEFFCYFVKFKPKILLLFIVADVMILLVFFQCFYVLLLHAVLQYKSA